jgi:predicted branched-subunit amino acid permease
MRTWLLPSAGGRAARVPGMAGGIVMVVVLLLFPIAVIIGGAVLAALIGTVLNKDARDRFEGSELLDLNA